MTGGKEISESDLILTSQQIERMQGEPRVHFLNPNAQRIRKAIGDEVGLTRIGVHLVYIEPGRDSTEHHKHYNEEECIYGLSGRGTLRIGEEEFSFGEGDFVGFPAGSAAHSLKNSGDTTLVILVMGQRLAQDTADYPDKGKRLYRNYGTWDLVDLSSVTDPRGGI
ncbi:MAG: cupin domain-containing protein [Zetaproteobacteria bacterium]|nr:MAG: cupin domain-containing protein [Zetaproteobacteria bacterium]